jgi:hypothetical protein
MMAAPTFLHVLREGLVADFSHVPAILQMTKPCRLSLGEVLGKFDENGTFDFAFTLRLQLDSGSSMPFQMRWIIRCRSEDETCWSSRLLLDNWAIDGVDCERRFVCLDGSRATGWHRHIWDISTASCDGHKEPLGGFGNFESRRHFVRDVSNILGLELRQHGGEEHGTTGLLFGQGIDD